MCTVILAISVVNHKYRCCQRFIPVSVVCRAIPEDIQKHVTDVLAPHFYQDKVLLKVYTHGCRQDVNITWYFFSISLQLFIKPATIRMLLEMTLSKPLPL